MSIIQELLAILTTRKEASAEIISRSVDSSNSNNMENVKDQSSRFIKDLMAELTQFGDGVSGDADRNNDYQNQWREALKSEEKEGNVLVNTFNSMEQTLLQFYRQILSEGNELQDSLKTLISNQEKELTAAN